MTQEQLTSRLKPLLKSIGLTTFVKYYLVFKYYSNEKCIQAFDEDFTGSSKRTKTSSAKSIFKEGLNIEALKYIRDTTKKASALNKAHAAWLLQLEE